MGGSRPGNAKLFFAIVGFACYLAWTVTYNGMGPLTSSASLTPFLLNIIFRMIPACILLVLTVFLKPSSTRYAHSTFLLIILIVWLLSAIVLIFLPYYSNFGISFLSIVEILCQCSLAVLLQFRWAHYYASEQNYNIGFQLILSMLLAALFRTAMTLPIVQSYEGIIRVFPVVSTICALMVGSALSRDEASETIRLDVTEITKYRFLYFGSRVLWGLSSGAMIALGVVQINSSSSSSDGLLVVASMTLSAALIIAVFIYVLQKGSISIPDYVIVGLPLAIAAAIFIPYFNQSSEAIARIGLTITFMAWLIQSFYQLHTYSTMLRIRPMLLAYTEKTVMIVSSLVGYLLGSQLLAALITWDNAVVLNYVFFAKMVFVYLLLFASTFAIARHIWRYIPKRQDPNTDVLRYQKGIDSVVGLLASEYGLTAREQEVFSLLAQGYSRPYIEKALFISKGTAKTHIFHIYQKLPVDSQDGLLVFVRDRSESP